MSDTAKLHQLGSSLTEFNRLERAFAAKGWRMYQLDGEKLYLTIPAWGMHRTVPDLRTARTLLRKIGGG
jgi:triphosphoribosyl-dephospho-CoA synthetase